MTTSRLETERALGILGVGVFLDDEVRRNDWWSPQFVAQWRERGTRSMLHDIASNETGPGALAAIKYLAALADDPFKGARERRVAPHDLPSSEMETRAAREAIQRAGVSPSDIELVLVHSTTPDYLNTPNACKIHHALGLPERCFTMSIEGMCPMRFSSTAGG